MSIKHSFVSPFGVLFATASDSPSRLFRICQVSSSYWILRFSYARSSCVSTHVRTEGAKCKKSTLFARALSLDCMNISSSCELAARKKNVCILISTSLARIMRGINKLTTRINNNRLPEPSVRAKAAAGFENSRIN